MLLPVKSTVMPTGGNARALVANLPRRQQQYHEELRRERWTANPPRGRGRHIDNSNSGEE